MVNSRKALSRWGRSRGILTIGDLLRPSCTRHAPYDDNFVSWAEASRGASGYDADAIVDRVVAANQEVLAGRYAYERDSVLFAAHDDFNWQLVSGLLLSAAMNKGSLNVLDFGGSLASQFFQNSPLLELVSDCTWSVVEQPKLVSAGTAGFTDPRFRFFSTIPECLENRNPKVALFSSSLQYLEDPAIVLSQLESSDVELLVVDRLPVSEIAADKFAVQAVPKHIYPATYPLRVFGKETLELMLGPSWDRLSTWIASEGSEATKSGLTFTWKGFIFHRARPLVNDTEEMARGCRV